MTSPHCSSCPTSGCFDDINMGDNKCLKLIEKHKNIMRIPIACRSCKIRCMFSTVSTYKVRFTIDKLPCWCPNREQIKGSV